MIFSIASVFLLCAAPAVQVEPRRIDDLLANPGMGWQTFHCFADEDPALAGLPSSCAYFRFYWKELEPEEGAVAFEKLDALLARAHKAGQKLAFRIMCAGTRQDYLYVPKWLKDKGCPGFEYRRRGVGPKHWVPDMDSPIFKKAHFRLIRRLGERYDGHPDLDLIDIGSVGLWGEWHMSGTGVPLPSSETRLAIIDAYINAFPRTPKVMLIGDEKGLRYAVQRGCGWRADCLGDMGGFSKTWCHMRDFYPQQIEKTGAGGAWRKAPVAFETCWDMRKWKAEGWNIREIFDFALKYHASYINNKSAPIPEGTRGEVERVLRRLGYRLVLRRFEHPSSIKAGRMLNVTMWWVNKGVAPPYRDYRVALRLRAGKRCFLLKSRSVSIKGWLPGDRVVKVSYSVPTHTPPGSYGLDLGILDPRTGKPAVRIAIEGRRPDGWYSLSRITVTREAK